MADVGIRPHDDVAGRREQRLPERLALAAERAVAREHVQVLDDACSLGLGDLARPIGRRGVDDEDLVEQRTRPTISRIACARSGRSSPPRRASVARADTVTPCFSLSWTSRRSHRTRRDGSSTRRTSAPRGPARPGFFRLPDRRRSTRPSSGVSNVVPADLLARLDDDDRRLGTRGDRLGQCPEQVQSTPSPPGTADAPIDHEVGLLGLTQDRVPTLGASRGPPRPCPSGAA